MFKSLSIFIHLIIIIITLLSCCCQCHYGCSDHTIRTTSFIPTRGITPLSLVYTNDIHPTRRLHSSYTSYSTLERHKKKVLPSLLNKKLQQQFLLHRQEQEMTFNVEDRNNHDSNSIVHNQTQMFLLHYENNDDINQDFEYWNTIGIPITGVTILLILLVLGIVSPPIIITNLLLFALLRTIANQLILYEDDYDDGNDDNNNNNNNNNNSNESRNLKENDDEMKFSQWQVDATTFILSFFVAITLIPSTVSTDKTISNGSTGSIIPNNPFVVASVITIICIGIWFNNAIVSPMIKDEQLTFQELLLKLWDNNFVQFLQHKKHRPNDTDQNDNN